MLLLHYSSLSAANRRVLPKYQGSIIAALDYATALAFPEDNGHFQLTVQLDITDTSKRAMRDAAIFERFLAEVPTIAPWLDAGEPTGEPEPMASVGNCRKQIFLGTPVVTGLLMVGDAAVHTNPSAGRGVALALAHAQALANLVSEAGNSFSDPAKLMESWEGATSKLLDPWFNSQIRIDHERRSQIGRVLRDARGTPQRHHRQGC